MPTVSGYTLGCKVSQYETEAILEQMALRGYTVVEPDTPADICLINTCTVTAESDRKSRQMIRRAVKRSPGACVVVLGCYSQRAAEEVAAIEGVTFVRGTAGKMDIPDLADAYLRGESGERVLVGSLEGQTFEPMCVAAHRRTRAYVKIEDGCECRCSYCAIADARGPVRSKPCEQVVAEVEELSRRGTREVVLTGIETGSWGRDLDEGVDLADLIVLLDKRRSVHRIRLGSLAPELCGRAFAEKLRGVGIMVPHFHLSLQSGSDRILALMRRRYTSARAFENIERLREIFPDACFTTDLMVGFPGETEEDFEKTADFVRRARFLDVHVFAYSRRRGTPAAELPGQIPEQIKRERSRRLIEVKNAVRDSVLDGICGAGKPLQVILESRTEGFYTAHSDSFVEVRVEGEEGRTGEEVTVLPLSHEKGVILGKIV